MPCLFALPEAPNVRAVWLRNTRSSAIPTDVNKPMSQEEIDQLADEALRSPTGQKLCVLSLSPSFNSEDESYSYFVSTNSVDGKYGIQSSASMEVRDFESYEAEAANKLSTSPVDELMAFVAVFTSCLTGSVTSAMDAPEEPRTYEESTTALWGEEKTDAPPPLPSPVVHSEPLLHVIELADDDSVDSVPEETPRIHCLSDIAEESEVSSTSCEPSPSQDQEKRQGVDYNDDFDSTKVRCLSDITECTEVSSATCEPAPSDDYDDKENEQSSCRRASVPCCQNTPVPFIRVASV